MSFHIDDIVLDDCRVFVFPTYISVQSLDDTKGRTIFHCEWLRTHSSEDIRRELNGYLPTSTIESFIRWMELRAFD
jgi:hypothetical protein